MYVQLLSFPTLQWNFSKYHYSAENKKKTNFQIASMFQVTQAIKIEIEGWNLNIFYPVFFEDR